MMSATQTPPRHNYSNTHTPIASIKRPRSSLTGKTPSSSANGTTTTSTTTTTTTPPTVVMTSSSSARSNSRPSHLSSSPMDESATPTPTPSHSRPPPAATLASLSPMHPIKAVPQRRLPTATTTTTTALPPPREIVDTTTTTTSATSTSMAAASWVGRKVDALFSPVLRFLDHQQAAEQLDDEDQDCHRGTNPTKNDYYNHNDEEEDAMILGKEQQPHLTATTATTTPSSSTSSASSSSSPGNTIHTGHGRNPHSLLEDDKVVVDDYDDDDDDDAEQHNLIHHHHQDMDDGNHPDDTSLSIQGQEMPEADEFNPWQFIQSLPPYHQVKFLTPPVALPPKRPSAPPITLVLDLDETLVHCSVEPMTGADLTFPVDFHGTTYQVHVKLRPHLFTFLENCRHTFEVIVFTASQKIYANELLNRIDPEGKYIQHRLYRESCLAVEGNFLKDLTVLGRDLAKVILVDNSPHAFGYQVDNGIPIESWFDDPHDRELLKLDRFLQQHFGNGGGGGGGGGSRRNATTTTRSKSGGNGKTSTASTITTTTTTPTTVVTDVRPILRRKFQCQKLVQEAPPLYPMMMMGTTMSSHSQHYQYHASTLNQQQQENHNDNPDAHDDDEVENDVNDDDEDHHPLTSTNSNNSNVVMMEYSSSSS